MLTGGIRKLSTMNDLISNHNIDMIYSDLYVA